MAYRDEFAETPKKARGWKNFKTTQNNSKQLKYKSQ